VSLAGTWIPQLSLTQWAQRAQRNGLPGPRWSHPLGEALRRQDGEATPFRVAAFASLA
jgi:hypothetical protein